MSLATIRPFTTHAFFAEQAITDHGTAIENRGRGLSEFLDILFPRKIEKKSFGDRAAKNVGEIFVGETHPCDPFIV